MESRGGYRNLGVAAGSNCGATHGVGPGVGVWTHSKGDDQG